MPLTEDHEHATYDADQVTTYFDAATQAALVLAAFRAPYRGRSTPINAWWGTFDLAVHFFSGRPADPPSDDFIVRNGGDAEQIEVGWWPGDSKYGRAAFYCFAYPPRDALAEAQVAPETARWDTEMGEFLLDWEDIRSSPDPRIPALEFAHSAFQQGCAVCEWDPALPASAAGNPPPVH
jgi:hypothetical protein